MFTSRHLNFGYLLVIPVVFVIAISASCTLAYAEEATTAGTSTAQKDVIQITIDAETGNVESVIGGVIIEGKEGGVDVFEAKCDKIEKERIRFDINNVEDLKGRIKKIIPAVIFTHSGSHYIDIWIDGWRWRWMIPH